MHGILVSQSPHFVLQHLLMNAKVGIRVKVIVLGGHLVHSDILSGAILHLLIPHSFPNTNRRSDGSFYLHFTIAILLTAPKLNRTFFLTISKQ
jgi:hypothetical protein